MLPTDGAPLNYTAISADELITLARQHQIREDWEVARKFAIDLYGSRAYCLHLDVRPSYDDEMGQIDLEITGDQCTDAKGNQLSYDFTASYWVTPFNNQQGSTPLNELDALLGDLLEDPEELEEWRQKEASSYLYSQAIYDEYGLSVDGTGVFFIQESPQVNHERVYVVVK